MTSPRDRGRDASAGEQDDSFAEIDIDRILAMARRQMAVVLVMCCLGLALGAVYAFTAVPLYTAGTNILIDNRTVRSLEDMAAASAIGADTAAVDSQVEVLRSEQIGLRVVERHNLHEDPAFMSDRAGLVGSLIGVVRSTIDVRRWFGSDGEILLDVDERKRAAIGRLRANLEVRRVGRTYVLEARYTAESPGQAARVANAVAEAYLTDQLESKYEATRRASGWLQERIAELREQSRASDLAIQRFRADNNLIATGNRLVSEQQLSEISSQLIIARADTARARARYDRIRAIIDMGQSDAIVGEALEQPVFNTLRSRYLDAAKRLADLSERLGPGHVQVINLRNEIDQYGTLIFEELGRIGESYLSDYEVAQSRERSLSQSLDDAIGVTASANETLVTLRELEGQSATYRLLLENFQQRFQEAVQQQSFPIVEARVITPASAPAGPSHPRKSLVLALSLMLGAAAGVGIGLFREYSDRVFRTGAQVRDDLDAEFLGMLPLVDGPKAGARRSDQAELRLRGEFAAPPIMRHALDQPLSSYAETLRSVKVAADVSLADNTSRIIGVVSMLPSEGKSTTAKNFASLLARQGAKVLLIDSDLRNPGMTRALSPASTEGLLEALLHARPVAELLVHEPDSGLSFLPAVVKTRISHTADLMASPAMRALLNRAAESFDYVIVDCPPIGPVIDVRAAADLFDAFVFVVEWGKTARSAVRTILQNEPRVRDRCLGIVLNKVDAEKLTRYESYGSKDYYYGRYSNYYRQ